jgi:KaiC/GvpD/RAD55 family RecA-like ATPase
LISSFWVKYPDADVTIYNSLFKTLQETPISADVGLDTLKQINRRKDALKLSEMAYKAAQGLASYDDLQKQYDKLAEDDSDSDLPLADVSLDLDTLLAASYSEQGLRWRLDCLNKSLGSLRDGDFGFIFARPETGKTTFLTSEITCMLTQATKPIIWFNNEEQGSKVMLRVYQAYFGVSMATLMSNPKKFRQEFLSQVGDRFKLFDSAVISKYDVQRIVERLDPCLVIYDQLTKIRGFKADRDDLRLGAIFQWARELAKGSHAAIGVSQADGSAENVRYLTMEHVANVKTAVQAEADWILGIGKIHDDTQQYSRFLNIPKNKLFGDKDSIAELRHGKFEVLIEPAIARYRDVVSYS